MLALPESRLLLPLLRRTVALRKGALWLYIFFRIWQVCKAQSGSCFRAQDGGAAQGHSGRALGLYVSVFRVLGKGARA
jgi:hypothetical protein